LFRRGPARQTAAGGKFANPPMRGQHHRPTPSRNAWLIGTNPSGRHSARSARPTTMTDSQIGTSLRGLHHGLRARAEWTKKSTIAVRLAKRKKIMMFRGINDAWVFCVNSAMACCVTAGCHDATVPSMTQMILLLMISTPYIYNTADDSLSQRQEYGPTACRKRQKASTVEP
jgi:hypothetical protein